jgi:hypothetical protein
VITGEKSEKREREKKEREVHSTMREQRMLQRANPQ